MKKFHYTEEEKAEIEKVKKTGSVAETSKVIRAIRKKCVAENRFEEVDRVIGKKESAEELKESEASECDSEETTSVIIK